MRRTLNGPGGIRIELDSREISPDDPGQGTPAMVYADDENGKERSATYWCACDTGELDGISILSLTQINWLHEQDDNVSAFIEAHQPD